MDSTYRFNRDEISKILKRAAELEHADNIEDDSDGLTLQELQQVSKEVGIDPKYIQQAFRQLQAPTRSLTSKLLGGPFKYNILESVPGTLSEKEWEDIVSEIRRIHGGIGKTSRLGNTFEWEQRKQEVGYIQISLSPKKDYTKIHINANYRYYASIIYTFAGGFGVIFLLSFFKKMGFDGIVPPIAAAIGTTGILATARFYLSNWMKKKRKTYDELINRFQKMLGVENPSERSPSITVPEGEELHIHKTTSRSNQKNKVTD